MIISPTVGRVMWFWPNESRTQSPRIPVIDFVQPCCALVTFVHGDDSGKVNLSVVDHYGEARAMRDVLVVQDGESKPEPGTPFVSWMPYQIGQAKKHAA